MKVYVLEAVMGSLENISVETIGVYSNQKNALKALKKLPAETQDLVYNIEIFKIDAPPRDIFDDSYEDVKDLMDKGIIDQLVGEDGRFYYTLTEKGREIANNIKKKNKDDNSQP
tara:strand:+ start:151 stop:492 length:342 start_codon:yes stop_codon:yes gene_type:complete